MKVSSTNEGDACACSVVLEREGWSRIETFDSPADDTGDGKGDPSKVVLVGVDARLSERRDTKDDDADFNAVRAELDVDKRLETEWHGSGIESDREDAARDGPGRMNVGEETEGEIGICNRSGSALE